MCYLACSTFQFNLFTFLFIPHSRKGQRTKREFCLKLNTKSEGYTSHHRIVSDKIRHNLDLQPTSSRNSGKFPADASNAVSKALRNPLILEVIFGELNIPALKQARLVCHEWDDVAGTLLGKWTYLHVNKVVSFKSAAELCEITPVAVHDQVIRRLLISDKFDPSIPADEKALVIKKALSSVAHKGSQLTREIKFRAAEKEFIPAFLEAIRSFGCTKMEKIDLSSIWRVGSYYTIPPETYQKLPPQSNLSWIRFKIYAGIEPTFPFGPHEFQPYLQIWLDAATNLTRLDVATNFYPDLEGCKNLKFLRYKFVRLTSYEVWNRYPDLNLAKVAKMLGQVKNSLIELELRHSIVGAEAEANIYI
ncbi:uncharacterized protein LOC118437740 [Folsomia candida]|uniref:uncharacterized protein LOC118437740 n=1 Tax=Folsomia candida TaxID=158441 RepID=UPI0016054D8A|nr:uncharacterized protein LOC118437740 [Folsomia candida]